MMHTPHGPKGPQKKHKAPDSPPDFVVREADGTFYAGKELYDGKSSSSFASSPADNTPQLPKKAPPVRPWMVMLAVCLAVGAGVSILLALNPPALPPVEGESSQSSQSPSDSQTDSSKGTLPAFTPPTAPTVPSLYYEPTTSAPTYNIEQSMFNGALQIYGQVENDRDVKGIVDRDFNTVIPHVYSDIRIVSPQRFLAAVDGKWGLINRENQVLYPMEADNILYLTDYEGGNPPLLVEKGNQWMLYDLDGKPLSDTVWQHMEFAEDGIIAVADGKSAMIDYQGRILTEMSGDTPQIYQTYYDGALKLMCRYGNEGKYFGLQDREGNTIIPADYPDIQILNPQRILVRTSTDPYDEERRAAVFDDKGNTVLDFVYHDLTTYPNADGDYRILIAQEGSGGLDSCLYILDLDGSKILPDNFAYFTDYDPLTHRLTLYGNRKAYTLDCNGSIVDVDENTSHFPNT